jgi:hypothetical protein
MPIVNSHAGHRQLLMVAQDLSNQKDTALRRVERTQEGRADANHRPRDAARPLSNPPGVLALCTPMRALVSDAYTLYHTNLGLRETKKKL